MCGIVGYTGPQSAATPLIEGLRRLEYRGYDSAGIALGTPGKLFVEKKAGKLVNLENSLDASLPVVHSGIGHTRWATHGGPTDHNAHPHLDNDEQNKGESYECQKKYSFSSKLYRDPDAPPPHHQRNGQSIGVRGCVS